MWLDRNLGAKKVCEFTNDFDCYGDYFQWGRSADGHEKLNSQKTTQIANSTTPGHGKYILGTEEYDFVWTNKINSNKWEEKNDPCPSGFRIPNIDELASETTMQGVKNMLDAFESFLRLPPAGMRVGTTGASSERMSIGHIWTNEISKKYKQPHILDIPEDIHFSSDFYTLGFTYGASILCIRD